MAKLRRGELVLPVGDTFADSQLRYASFTPAPGTRRESGSGVEGVWAILGLDQPITLVV